MDLDGDVDADDYSKIDAGYAQQLSGYWNGDLDFNGRINADDFFVIDRAFSSDSNSPTGALFPASAAVPEPAAVGLGLFLAAGFTFRPRRVCFDSTELATRLSSPKSQVSTPSSGSPARDTSAK
jgi:hypothetical protein